MKPHLQTTIKPDGKLRIVGGEKGELAYEPEYLKKIGRSQAQHIIEKFGGAGKLAKILREISDDPEDHYNRTTIYRWMYPKEAGGTGGEIPTAAMKTIVKIARRAGVLLTEKDLMVKTLY